jgi:hypothetical protein
VCCRTYTGGRRHARRHGAARAARAGPLPGAAVGVRVPAEPDSGRAAAGRVPHRGGQPPQPLHGRGDAGGGGAAGGGRGGRGGALPAVRGCVRAVCHCCSSPPTYTLVCERERGVCVCVCLCEREEEYVCVCVCVRESTRERYLLAASPCSRITHQCRQAQSCARAPVTIQCIGHRRSTVRC